MLAFLLCAQDRGHETGDAYQVAVTGLEGLVDGLADLTGSGLPGTKAQLAVRVH